MSAATVFTGGTKFLNQLYAGTAPISANSITVGTAPTSTIQLSSTVSNELNLISNSGFEGQITIPENGILAFNNIVVSNTIQSNDSLNLSTPSASYINIASGVNIVSLSCPASNVLQVEVIAVAAINNTFFGSVQNINTTIAGGATLNYEIAIPTAHFTPEANTGATATINTTTGNINGLVVSNAYLTNLMGSENLVISILNASGVDIELVSVSYFLFNPNGTGGLVLP